MIVYSDGSWECGADEEKISDGATIIDDNSSTAQQIRQHTRVSITDGIVKAISDRQGEIVAELDALDLRAIRPLRAIAAGTATEADRRKVAEIETEAKKLRKKIGTTAEEESADGQ